MKDVNNEKQYKLEQRKFFKESKDGDQLQEESKAIDAQMYSTNT